MKTLWCVDNYQSWIVSAGPSSVLYGCLVDTGDNVIHVWPRAEKLTSCTFQTTMDAPGPSSSSSIFPSLLSLPSCLWAPFHCCFGLFKLGKVHNECKKMHLMSGKIIPLLLFCGAVDTVCVQSFPLRFWTLKRWKCIQEAPTESRLWRTGVIPFLFNRVHFTHATLLWLSCLRDSDTTPATVQRSHKSGVTKGCLNVRLLGSLDSNATEMMIILIFLLFFLKPSQNPSVTNVCSSDVVVKLEIVSTKQKNTPHTLLNLPHHWRGRETRKCRKTSSAPIMTNSIQQFHSCGLLSTVNRVCWPVPIHIKHKGTCSHPQELAMECKCKITNKSLVGSHYFSCVFYLFCFSLFTKRNSLIWRLLFWGRKEKLAKKKKKPWKALSKGCSAVSKKKERMKTSSTS